MTPEELVQLMRLSGTGKVRLYLEKMYKIVQEYPDGKAAEVYSGLIDMFKLCQRSNPKEGW